MITIVIKCRITTVYLGVRCYSWIRLAEAQQCTEVSRAPLIHFQKMFFKKGFYKSKLARELKFYTWIIIAGSKSLKKGQKMLKKATNLV